MTWKAEHLLSPGTVAQTPDGQKWQATASGIASKSVNLPQTPLEMRAYATKLDNFARRELHQEARNILTAAADYWRHRADLEDGLECRERAFMKPRRNLA